MALVAARATGVRIISRLESVVIKYNLSFIVAYYAFGTGGQILSALFGPLGA